VVCGKRPASFGVPFFERFCAVIEPNSGSPTRLRHSSAPNVPKIGTWLLSRSSGSSSFRRSACAITSLARWNIGTGTDLRALSYIRNVLRGAPICSANSC
jgi:hypothetical protein